MKGGQMIKLHKPDKPSINNLKNVYDVCNKIFSSEKCFYSNNQVNELKQDQRYIFLESSTYISE